MGKATTIEIKRKKRHDSTRIKGARDPAKVRRRLNRFRNKQRSMSKNWDARLENEPQGQEDERPNSRQVPRGVENQLMLGAALKNSGDPMLNNPYPNEESSDEGGLMAHNPFPNEASSDEGGVSHNPFPNELSSDEGPALHNPFPNEESSDEGVSHLPKPDENLFSHTGEPTSSSIASSTTKPPQAAKPNSPSKHSSPSEDGPAPSGPSSPKEPPTAKDQSPSGPSMPTIPTISVPTLSQPSRPSAGLPPRPSAPSPGPPSRPSVPTAPTDSQYPDVPSAPSRPTVPTDSQYPDIPSAGSPNAPSTPTIGTEDQAPSTPSQDTGLLTPSADPPLVEGPGGPDGLPQRDGPTVAPSTSFGSNPIPVPGAPTKPHKPTLPPAYFNPAPTPRPTKNRPTVPAPAIPTRRPTKSTGRPTYAPSVMQKEPPRPTAAKKTKRPTIISPVAYDTESPTFKYSRTRSPTRKPASPDEFSPDEHPLPTFPPNPPPTDEPTDPPTYTPTQQPTFKPTGLPSNLPTKTTPDPTATPSSLPTPFCKADEEGNYGFPTAPQELVIEYQYQVETTASVTEEDLNNVILPEMEKDISDALVPNLFFRNGECTGGVTAESRTSELGSAIIQDIEQYDKRTAQKWAMNILQQRERDHYQKPKGSRTDGWETSSSGGQRRLARQLQESDDLVGLTAAPPDFVIRDSLGRLQNACPFPVTGTGPDGQPLECWVIEGRLTVYGFGDLGWVEPVVETTLNEAMEDGAFDNGAVNSNVIYVRSIPPGTELVIPPDGAEGENNQSQSDGTPVWAWVLIGLGIFGVLLSVVYLILKRRQSQEDFEREKAETDFFAAEGGGGAGGEGGEGDENGKLVASSGASLYSGQYKNEYGEQKEEDGGNPGGNEGVEQVYEEQQGGYESVPDDEANPPAPAGGG